MRSMKTSMPAQRGAVLYVALIMLVLLALIGIVGLQVTGLQERMSANYRNANVAFQTAEAGARSIETGIQLAVAAGGTFEADQELCSPTFDPASWAADAATNQQEDSFTRRIDKCFASSSLVVGKKLNEETGNIYEVTALRSDLPTNATATAVIDTIFIP